VKSLFGYLFGCALGFFVVCLLIYFGAMLLREVWVILLIASVIVTGGVVAYRLWKNRTPKY